MRSNIPNSRLVKTFKGKIILVTGGTGSIGSVIVKKLLRFKPKQVRVYSRDESKHFFLQNELSYIKHNSDVRYLIGDIRDKERLDKACYKVDILFHTAALKHVPFCEYNPFEAIKTNVFGTQNIIDSSLKNKISKVVSVSTDKAVYPNTIMGITKLLMERMIITSQSYLGDSGTKLSIVRFGNILNSRGSVIPTWINQINNGGPITVTDKKMTRFFIETDKAVDRLLYAASIMKGQEIFVLKMIEENIFELAQETIKKYSNGKRIKIKITGAREREKMREKLFTEEEEESMLEKDKFYVIFPNRKEYLKNRDNYLISKKIKFKKEPSQKLMNGFFKHF